MEVKNCRGCGKLFNYVSGVNLLCPACTAELEDKFKIAKEFIKENVGATISEVAEKADVSVKQVEKWVREERLVFADNSLVGIECEACGTMIRSGRFCDACKGNMASGFGNLYKSEPKIQPKRDTKENPRMRFLSN